MVTGNGETGDAASSTVGVVLMDVVPGDVDWIARALGRWQCTDRWSSAWGRTPSPAALAHLAWHGIALQKVAVGDGDGRQPVALYQLADPDLVSGHASLDLLVDADRWPEVEQGLGEFLPRVFRTFPLRKLSLAAAADDLDLPRPLADAARLVGCLREHRHRRSGVYADVNLYEIWAEDWAR